MPDALVTQTDPFDFPHPISKFAGSLGAERKIRIVALGSSSTAGEGDVLSYPPRLEILLREAFPNRMIDVLNRGVGGEEAPAELERFGTDVFPESPALVIWQVGTNAVFHSGDFKFDDVIASIETGLRRLVAQKIDVVIMNSQFTPGVVDGAKLALSEDLVARIAKAADHVGVNVFRRFELMREWAEHRVPMEELVRKGDPQNLHMSEWSTNRVSRALVQSIKQAVAASTARKTAGNPT